MLKYENMLSKKISFKDNVHSVLAHSHIAYFISFLLGLFFHFLFPFKIYQHNFFLFLGLFFLIFASFLILWAAITSRKLNKVDITKETFSKGPYCYTRMPTHFGLFFLILGFGFIVNSFFIILFTLISFIVNKIFFINKQEILLLKKYGTPYLEYKKSVRF